MIYGRNLIYVCAVKTIIQDAIMASSLSIKYSNATQQIIVAKPFLKILGNRPL